MTRTIDAVAAQADAAETVPGLLQNRARDSPDGKGRWTLDSQARWQASDWRTALRQTSAAALGLQRVGLKAGARVGLMAPVSPQWDDFSMAVMASRGVVVGIDAHATAEQLRAIVQRVPLDALIVHDVEHLLRFGANAPGLCVLLQPGAGPLASGCVSAEALLAGMADAVDQAWNTAQPDDLALIVFTSGTTGLPKPIAYQHRQVLQAVRSILAAYADIRSDAHLACWLPLSNLFQRIVNLCAVERGACIFYVPDPKKVVLHLSSIRPAVFIGVPRFFEKFAQEAAARMHSGGKVRAAVGAWALRTALAHAELLNNGASPGLLLNMSRALADVLVLRRVRAALGGKLHYLVCGSAPMPPPLLKFFAALGLPVFEAYGLSECIVPLAANTLAAFRQGSVGRPLHGIELRLAGDGELLVRSDGIFISQLDDPSAARPVDADGFLHTGDLAEISAEGFVRLVGRKSEVFKLSTGRQVPPAQIEGLLVGVPGIEHLAVFGPGRKAVLLVVSLADGADPARVQAALAQHVRDGLSSLPSSLRPAGAVLTQRPFSLQTGELTANLKLRRGQVGLRYEAALLALDAWLAQPGVRALTGQVAIEGESVSFAALH